MVELCENISVWRTLDIILESGVVCHQLALSMTFNFVEILPSLVVRAQPRVWIFSYLVGKLGCLISNRLGGERHQHIPSSH